MCRELGDVYKRKIESDELVFHVDDACERSPMKMDPQRPRRDADYVHRPSTMEELGEEEARARVARGESLLVEGVAGVGNTQCLQSWSQELLSLIHLARVRRRG